MERRIRPHVPAMAKTTAMNDQYGRVSQPALLGKSVLDRTESTFSATPRFFAKRPVCRSHRSDAKERSRKTVVTQQPAMKRGFNPWAPISEI